MSHRKAKTAKLFVVIVMLAAAAAAWFFLQPEFKTAPLPVLERTENKDKIADEQSTEISALMKNADPVRGHSLVHMCNDCHTFDEDGPDRLGPNLHGIFGRHHATKPGYNYSDAMKSLSDRVWNEENLNAFLINPKMYAPGTRMGYPGVTKAENRADIIAYLKSLNK